MPDHHVGSLARSADGYLWLTTYGGLARFDGIRFERMGKDAVPGLATPWVAPVHVARDQTLWLGLERGGVIRWRRGGVAEEILPVQPRSAQALWPTSFAEDGAGAVWFGFGHEAKVFRWRAGELRAFTPDEGVPRGNWATVVASARGEIWCATHTGCARFDGDRFVAVDLAWESRRRIAPSAAGGMWAAGDARLFKYSDTGEKSLVTTLDAPPAGFVVEQMIEDRDGRLWIGASGAGLHVYHEGKLERVPTSFGGISVLRQDDEGTLWAGVWGGGLDRITPRRFFLHRTGRDSSESGVAAIATEANGRRWAVDRRGVPTVGGQGEAGRYSIPPAWPGGRFARVVCADAAGEVWIGTDSGLLRRSEEGFVETGPREAVAALFADGEHRLWAATTAGGVYLVGPKGVRAASFDRPLREVRAMARDAEGRMWFGTRDGSVFYAAGDRLHPVALPGAGGDETVRHIVPDGENVWIGTLLGGLYRWRAGEAARLPADPALPLAEFRVLHIQSANTEGGRAPDAGDDVFWFGTAQGLFSTKRREIERRLAQPGLPIGARRHRADDGLPALEFAEGGMGGLSIGRDGRPWFATNRGALEIGAAGMAHASRVETGGGRRVFIEAATLGDQPLPPPGAGEWRLPPRPGPLRIRYTLPELREPEQVRFRHRLTRFGDEEWSLAGPDREAVFLGLSPGAYRFEVAAAVGGDAWLPGVAVAGFSVEAVWWQRAPFRFFLLGALAAGIWGVVTARARARIRRAEQAQAVERERTRIARDMHDELGANLTQIGATSGLARTEPPEMAATRLREIGETARRSVEALDEIVWAVNPRYDSLAGTIEYLGKHAVRFLAATGVEREVDLPVEPPDLPLAADRRHHLLLVVKEALNNAVKHAHPKRVRFAAEVDRDELRVSVEDDGAGFDPERVDAFSNGLRNMRERMAAAGGRLVFERPAGGGTRVVAILCLRGATGAPLTARRSRRSRPT